MGNHLEAAGGIHSLDTRSHGVADSFQPFGDDQLSCRATVNSLGTFAVQGSSFVKGSRGGYGPWRLEPTFFKLKGGGTHTQPPL